MQFFYFTEASNNVLEETLKKRWCKVWAMVGSWEDDAENKVEGDNDEILVLWRLFIVSKKQVIEVDGGFEIVNQLLTVLI